MTEKIDIENFDQPKILLSGILSGNRDWSPAPRSIFLLIDFPFGQFYILSTL